MEVSKSRKEKTFFSRDKIVTMRVKELSSRAGIKIDSFFDAKMREKFSILGKFQRVFLTFQET